MHPKIYCKWLSALTVAMASIMLSCSPVDEALTPRVQAGDVLNNKGERLASCYSDKSDWDRMQLPADLDGKIQSGEVRASLAAGTYNCFRVGSKVSLQNGGDAPVRGHVKITKIEVLRYSDVTEAEAKAAGFTLNKMEKVIRQKLDRDNLVTLTYFEFLGEVKQELQHQDLRKPGQMFAECDPARGHWGRMDVKGIAYDKWKSGDVSLYVEIRPMHQRVCYQVGSEVIINDVENETELGHVKITRLAQKPFADLTADEAHLTNKSLEELKEGLSKDEDFTGEESRAVLIYFEFLESSENTGGAQ